MDFKKIIHRISGISRLENKLTTQHEERLLISGQILSRLRDNNKSITSLEDVEFKVFSQWGDDGITDWIFSILKPNDPFFIEFGVQTYQESNTRFLLQHRNWSGLVIDGNLDYINFIKSDDIYWKHSLTAINSFITKENINSLLSENSPKNDVDLLSIDIDGNDYWVFNELMSISPKVIICEFNGLFGADKSVTVPYEPNFVRSAAHHSNLYFGCSIMAIINLAKTKGYDFVGTNSNGNNAYFTRKDVSADILSKLNDEPKIYLPKFRESRDANGNLSYLDKLSALSEIAELELVDLDTEESLSIRSLYSL